MKLVFSSHAWDDYLYWQKQDRAMLQRINGLVKEILRDPFEGPGKPERLRHALRGYWSRRIDAEHRLVYRVGDGAVFLAQLRHHY